MAIERRDLGAEDNLEQTQSTSPVPSAYPLSGLAETGGRLFDLDGSRGLPYDLREGTALNSSSFYALEKDWNSTGAQEFPSGVVVVSNETVSQERSSSSVVYVGGPVGGQLVLFRTGA